MVETKIRKKELTNYSYIHQWNYENYPKNGICVHCGDKEKKHEWALKHGCKHSRGIENYIELCRKCHIIYDKTPEWTQKCVSVLRKIHPPIKPKKCLHCSLDFIPARKTRLYCSNKCAFPYKNIRKLDIDSRGRFLAINKK